MYLTLRKLVLVMIYLYDLLIDKNIVWDAIELNNGDIASCSSDNKIIVWKKKSD